MKNLAPFAPLYRLTCTHRVHGVGVGGGGYIRWVQLATCSLAPPATSKERHQFVAKRKKGFDMNLKLGVGWPTPGYLAAAADSRLPTANWNHSRSLLYPLLGSET